MQMWPRPLALFTKEMVDAVFTLLLETVGGKNCCTGGDNIILLQWGQFAKDNCSHSRRGHWQKLRFSSCGGNYFLAYFFFLQLSCWLLLTCFYWQNDFFFFLECQFHDTIILLPNPVIKRIKSIIYWFLERIGLLCLIYLFTLIWYQNPISATSKYNLPSNLENVVIFLNIAHMPQFWSCLDVAHKTARKELILPIETIAEALGSFFFCGAETAVR